MSTTIRKLTLSTRDKEKIVNEVHQDTQASLNDDMDERIQMINTSKDTTTSTAQASESPDGRLVTIIWNVKVAFGTILFLLASMMYISVVYYLHIWNIITLGTKSFLELEFLSIFTQIGMCLLFIEYFKMMQDFYSSPDREEETPHPGYATSPPHSPVKVRTASNNSELLLRKPSDTML